MPNNHAVLRVQEMMRPEPVCVREETAVQTVFDLVYQRHLSCLPVVDGEQRLSGCIWIQDLEKCRQLFELRDFLQMLATMVQPETRVELSRVLSWEAPVELTAREIMSVKLLTLQPTDSLDHAVDRMLSEKTHTAMVITPDKRLVGVLDALNLLEATHAQAR